MAEYEKIIGIRFYEEREKTIAHDQRKKEEKPQVWLEHREC